METIQISEETFISFLPKRDENTSKFDYGKATIIGGSLDYGGAPLLSLAALSALRLGVGFSILYVPEPLYSIYIGRNPQIIVHPFPSKNGNICFDEETIKSIANKSSSIAIGMGITEFEETKKILEYLLLNYHGSLIIDAGAITALSEIDSNYLKDPSCSLLITPHTGEFSRLYKKPRTEIEKNPLDSLLDYLEGKKMTVILKGHTTYISNGKETYVSSFGNTGLSKAGSGDLLSGILCGILAQNINAPFIKKAVFGSYLLGKSAELLLKEENEYSIIADDIIRILPRAIAPCVDQ